MAETLRLLDWLRDTLSAAGRWWPSADEAPPGVPACADGETPPQPPSLPAPAARSLVARALDERNLVEAWERVRSNDGAAGVDGQTVQDFGTHALARLQSLRDDVLQGRYRPRALLRVNIPKSGGRMRHLAVPSVRDRVLQTALAQVLRPLLEPHFEEASYGYRGGRSVAMAIARIVRLRDEGLRHVVDGDIEDFFDRIQHRLLLQQLYRLVPDDAVQELVALWLAAIVQDGPRAWLLERGVPQGSPLSPLLANLYLDGFDERLLAAGHRLVRYADDFVILCADAGQARRALDDARAALVDLQLRMNAAKTRLTHVEQGFTFLGVRFCGPLVEAVDDDAEPWLLPDAADHQRVAEHARRERQRALALGLAPDALQAAPRESLPSAAQPSESTQELRLLPPGADEAGADGPGAAADALLEALTPEGAAAALVDPDDETVRLLDNGGGPREPLVRTLYVARPGVLLLKEGERVTVARQREVLASVPMGELDQLLLQAPALVSTALLSALAARRIDVCLAGARDGELLTLERGALPDLTRQALQLRRHRQAGFHLLVARACVQGKLHNARVVLRRFNRRDPCPAVDEAITRLDASLRRLPQAQRLDELRGLEGQAAKAYFDALRALLPADCGFTARKRRPPGDMVNALLSFGYAVLAAQVHRFVRLERLNPHYGHLHATAAQGMGLVSDLMEEFRAVAVDAVVLTLLREGRLTQADFRYDAAADLPCRLGSQARKVYVQALEDKLDARFIHPRQHRLLDLRRSIQAQVRHYAAVLERREAAYLPLKLK
jgi:CRISPR-associated protein Cas1